jgi:hypothetical protein
MSDRDGRLIFDAGKMTVGEYLDRWLVDSARGTVRRSTYNSYQHQLRCNDYPKYVQELFGDASITLILDTYSHVLLAWMAPPWKKPRTSAARGQQEPGCSKWPLVEYQVSWRHNVLPAKQRLS